MPSEGPVKAALHVMDEGQQKTTRPVRVAFLGKMGVGKTTFANELMQHQDNVYGLSFAKKLKALKEAASLKGQERYRFISDLALYLLPPSQAPLNDRARLVTGWNFAVQDLHDGKLTVREFYQRVGTDVGRTVDPAIWIRPVVHEIRQHDDRSYVIDDLRFVNEADALADEDFFIVRVTLPEDVRRRRLSDRDGFVTDEVTMNHASEKEIDEIEVHYTLDNTGALEDARKELFDAVHSHNLLLESRREKFPYGVGVDYTPLSKAKSFEMPKSSGKRPTPKFAKSITALRGDYARQLEYRLETGEIESMYVASYAHKDGTVTHNVEYTERIG